MKLPSMISLFLGARKTLLRYPFVITISALGGIIMIYVVGQTRIDYDNQYLYNAAMTCILGIPLLLSLSFIAVKIKISKGVSFVWQIAGIILIGLYYYSLPNDIGFIQITRFFLFIIGFHLLVSFSLYLNGNIAGSSKSFWQFNQILFIRILTSALYSGVLFAGLSIAILSFDKLFNVNIDNKIYPQLFFFLAGFFNTWFFLSGMPENYEELETTDAYPKGLKIFTQYVLLPLVTVYLFILYLYTGKIIFQWQLPMGWVSYLVLGFSTTGIFSLLLVHPLRNLEGNEWIKKFAKWFYILLYPLVILLFVAILRRTSEYGITELRYFVFILAVWLAGTAIYFTFSKSKNIKLIPLSLCIIAFLSSFGPWSAFNISQKSQIGRLEEVLIKNNLLVNGKIKTGANQVKLTEEENSDVNSIVRFLEDRKLTKELQPWFEVNLDSVKGQTANLKYKDRTQQLVESMGIQYIQSKWKTDKKHINFVNKQTDVINLGGFDYLLHYNYSASVKDTTKTYYLQDSAKIQLLFEPENCKLSIFQDNTERINLNLKEVFGKIKPEIPDYELNNEFVLENQNEQIKTRFNLLNLSGERNGDTLKITTMNADVFIKVKK